MNDLLQKGDENMFGNPFTDQHRYDSYKPSDNEDYNMLGPNVTINVDDEIILLVSKFGDAS